MPLTAQDALIYLMVVAATSDAKVSDRELDAIGALVVRLPVFDTFNRDSLGEVAAEAIDLIKDSSSLDNVLDMILKALPERLHDTAYALAVEVATVDLLSRGRAIWGMGRSTPMEQIAFGVDIPSSKEKMKAAARTVVGMWEQQYYEEDSPYLQFPKRMVTPKPGADEAVNDGSLTERH